MTFALDFVIVTNNVFENYAAAAAACRTCVTSTHNNYIIFF
jgi:hypothetical protein